MDEHRRKTRSNCIRDLNKALLHRSPLFVYVLRERSRRMLFANVTYKPVSTFPTSLNIRCCSEVGVPRRLKTGADLKIKERMVHGVEVMKHANLQENPTPSLQLHHVSTLQTFSFLLASRHLTHPSHPPSIQPKSQPNVSRFYP